MSTIEYTREVTLPSKGLFYKGALEGGVLTIQAWTTKDQKLLAGAESVGPDLSSRLIANGILTPGVKMDDLITQDRMFLLVNIRALSYGELYRFQWRCEGGCKRQVADELDLLRDIKINYAEDGWKEPFDFKLPSGKILTLRYLRHEDEKAISSFAKNVHKNRTKSDGEPEYYYRIARRLVEVDGVPQNDVRSTMEMLEGLQGMDSLRLLDGLDYHEFGLDTELTRRCNACGWEEEMILPLGREFFRPRPRKPAGASEADLG
jgi:hypothetical protein